jgi:hypothetical protein
LVKEALPRRMRAAFFNGIDGVDKIDLTYADTHPLDL